MKVINVRVEEGHAGAVIHVAGEVDLVTAPTLHACLTSQQGSHQPPPVLVLNLAEVDFMSCAGLHVLLDARSHAAAHGTTLLLNNCSRPVLRLLELSRLNTHFVLTADYSMHPITETCTSRSGETTSHRARGGRVGL